MRAIVVIGVVVLIRVCAAVSWPSEQMRSKDICCSELNTARGKEICTALVGLDAMDVDGTRHCFTRMARDVGWAARGILPGACHTAADLPVLEQLTRNFGSDWRLQDGAEDLVRLVKSETGTSRESENSIFNPKNPDCSL